MKLVDSSIKYPVTVIVGVLFIALFGLISLFRIPIQLTPDIDRPVINVSTFWPGASPLGVEQEIVQKQEEQLNTLVGLVKMTSDSQDSRGNIILEFSVGVDPDATLLRVSNKLNQVTQYPPTAKRPVLTSGTAGNSNAITWVILEAQADYLGKIDVETYRDFAEDVIETAFERVKGVGQSNIYGGFERELQIIVDPQALAARRITVSAMINAIRSENINLSAGSFDEGKRRYIVRTVGQYRHPDDIAAVVIHEANGNRTTVGDVARINLGFKRQTTTVRQKGQPVIAINATRETGANVL